MKSQPPVRGDLKTSLAGLLALLLILLAHTVEARSASLHCSDINQDGMKRYQRIIDQAERRHGVNAALIAAVIQTESNFDSRARSRVGARGLMQLMPQTAHGLEIRDAYNPRQNVDGGTRYLKQQILRFGDVGKGLWAYNAGPHRVESNKLFEETQQYIPKVLFYYQCLKQREH
ncbi:MAG: transglycosylase SLT domain-containing protein [Candidatus Thiodiazotropha taylori]